ncbi:MAG: M28 family peptidase [Woeseia sp.]|nr:M28 family peptidase [Woeseia sp.]MBT8096817.1 M28 family peptidase [Woeseia sp.]
MNAIKTLLATIIFVLLAACSSEQADSTDSVGAVGDVNPAERAVALITAESMRGPIIELSDDRYEGRGPGSAGDRMARQYIIEQMQDIGLQPGAADGAWEQTFNLIGVTAEQPSSWEFEADDGSLTFKQWDQFIVGSGVQAERAEVADAEVVFVGYGIQAPEYDWDDFKGVDLTGKIALIMNNDPDWDPDLFAGETRLYYGRWGYKYESVARQGAVGAIIIHTTPSAGYPFQVVQTSWTGEQFELPAGDEPRSQIEAWVTEDAARQLVALGGHDLDALREAADNRDFQPVPLGVTTSFGMDVSLTKVETANVLGLIPGSDPELKDEAVIYTAHHDHLGIGTPNAEGDAIYNGAMDNAAGVSQILAIARAIISLPQPARRSILFAFVGAEEQGLLGSMYYAANPTFPPGKIAANINYDGGNIWGHTHDVTYIGLGKSTIDDIVESIAQSQQRVVKADQYADRGYFYRSDQFSFAKIGVPALYLDSGTDYVDRPAGWGKEQHDHYTEVHYHQPSDEYDDSWNFDGMIDDARLGFWTGLSIAVADEMPRWNPGDEFEAARLEALEAVAQ